MVERMSVDLAERIRAALKNVDHFREVKMFGGIAFMLNGNMMASASKRGVLLRVGKERQAEALMRPGTRPMEMKGRVMEGYIYLDPATVDDSMLREWLLLAHGFTRTLPAK